METPAFNPISYVFSIPVFVQGKQRTSINRILAEKQKLTDTDLAEIKNLHVARILMEDAIFLKANKENVSDEEIQDFLKAWTENQFALQRAWKFQENQNFHKFFDIPGCTCGIDQEVALLNTRNYPNGDYKYSHKCYLHRKMATD